MQALFVKMTGLKKREVDRMGGVLSNEGRKNRLHVSLVCRSGKQSMQDRARLLIMVGVQFIDPAKFFRRQKAIQESSTKTLANASKLVS